MLQVILLTENEYLRAAEFLSEVDFVVVNPKSKDPFLWERRFRWWWDKNPAFKPGMERGWCLKDNDKIVGFIGVIPSKFQLSGRETTVLNGTTWAVLPEYRQYSMQLLAKQLNTDKDTLFFNTTMNELSLGIIKACKFRLLPRGLSKENKKHQSVIFLKPENVVQKKLKSSFLANSAGKLIDIYQFFKINKIKNSNLADINIIDTADSYFDKLWEKTKNCFQNTNIRNQEFIKWHCFVNEDFKKTCFGYFKGQTLLGYIIFSNNEYLFYSRGLKVFECLDLWFDFKTLDHSTIGSLLNYALCYAKERDCDLMLFHHFNKLVSTLFKQIGLLSFTFGERRDYFYGSAEIIKNINSENSYFSYMQGDYGL